MINFKNDTTDLSAIYIGDRLMKELYIEPLGYAVKSDGNIVENMLEYKIYNYTYSALDSSMVNISSLSDIEIDDSYKAWRTLLLRKEIDTGNEGADLAKIKVNFIEASLGSDVRNSNQSYFQNLTCVLQARGLTSASYDAQIEQGIKIELIRYRDMKRTLRLVFNDANSAAVIRAHLDWEGVIPSTGFSESTIANLSYLETSGRNYSTTYWNRSENIPVSILWNEDNKRYEVSIGESIHWTTDELDAALRPTFYEPCFLRITAATRRYSSTTAGHQEDNDSYWSVRFDLDTTENIFGYR